VNTSIQDVVRSVGTVVSPPQVYLKLVEVINHPRSGPADVGRVLSEDPGLTARLLKLVNSAMFSFPQRIGSLTHAVQVVGTAQVRDLALATSIVSTFEGVPDDLVDMESFWRHSLACGVAARSLAAIRRENNVERFFVAGLLHDVGRLVLFLALPDAMRTAILRARETGEVLHDVERDVMGFDHAQVGSALMSGWNFPGVFTEVIAYHHMPALAGKFPIEAAAVHAGDVIANGLSIGSSGQAVVPHLEEGAWAQLGIDPTLTPILLDDIERQYKDAAYIQLGLAA
jgi:HD-like signal output (HDOD) protein